ncbi:MAG: Periplasmic serine endoprotease DegP-like, partial [Hyphomicrobiales bacterium]|nr:Periplasmic serine endoprotease DegP-like [Hyphomicrobiales bacterium]
MLRSFAFTVLLIGGLLPASAQQPQRVAPENRAQITLSYSPLVKKAQPSVVNVYGSRTERRQANPLFDDPIF